jgi:hypothetical protein
MPKIIGDSQRQVWRFGASSNKRSIASDLSAPSTYFSREQVNRWRNNSRLIRAEFTPRGNTRRPTGRPPINVPIKGRECRVLASLKRRLASPSPCNLRRDYGVRLWNPVRTRLLSARRETLILFSISIQADAIHIARLAWQLFGQ